MAILCSIDPGVNPLKNLLLGVFAIVARGARPHAQHLTWLMDAQLLDRDQSVVRHWNSEVLIDQSSIVPDALGALIIHHVPVIFLRLEGAASRAQCTSPKQQTFLHLKKDISQVLQLRQIANKVSIIHKLSVNEIDQ